MLRAQDLFDRTRAAVLELAKLEARADLMRSKTESRTQTYEAAARKAYSQSRDGKIIAAMEAYDDLDRQRARTDPLIETVTRILYGKSGRGGLARVMGTDTADMLLFHYCQGESWYSIGKRYEVPGNLTTWCKRQANKAFATLDRVGMRQFIES